MLLAVFVAAAAVAVVGSRSAICRFVVIVVFVVSRGCDSQRMFRFDSRVVGCSLDTTAPFPVPVPFPKPRNSSRRV